MTRSLSSLFHRFVGVAMFRALRFQISRSFAVAKTVGSNSVPWLNAGIGKQMNVCAKFLGTKPCTTYDDLAKSKTFTNGYEDLPELQSADENVRRIFSLANASQQEKRKVIHSELVKKCNNAQERKIAKMSVSIVNLEGHLQKMRNKDKHNKVYLQWLKDQRTKKLKSLKMSNFERYIELIKELNVEPLASTHSKYAKYKFRQFKIGVEIKEKKSQAVRKNPAQLKHAG